MLKQLASFFSCIKVPAISRLTNPPPSPPPESLPTPPIWAELKLSEIHWPTTYPQALPETRRFHTLLIAILAALFMYQDMVSLTSFSASQAWLTQCISSLVQFQKLNALHKHWENNTSLPENTPPCSIKDQYSLEHLVDHRQSPRMAMGMGRGWKKGHFLSSRGTALPLPMTPSKSSFGPRFPSFG